MGYTMDELTEARRALDSMIAKLETALAGLAPAAKPQRTLATRRLAALRLARELVEREVSSGDRDTGTVPVSRPDAA